jgi:hypothetical protein
MVALIKASFAEGWKAKPSREVLPNFHRQLSAPVEKEITEDNAPSPENERAPRSGPRGDRLFGEALSGSAPIEPRERTHSKHR